MSNKHYSLVIDSASKISPAIQAGFGKKRYPCFDRNDPYVRLDHFSKMELDHFDRMDDTTYIMVMASEGDQQELVSGVRLRPTTADYELEMPSYRYLTKEVFLPKKPHIMEGSRWVGKSSHTPEGMLSTGMLMMALYRFCHSIGVSEIIGTISTKSEGWLSRRAAQAQRSSDPYYSARDDLTILVSTIPLDDTFLGAAQKLLTQAITHFEIMDMTLSEKAA